MVQSWQLPLAARSLGAFSGLTRVNVESRAVWLAERGALGPSLLEAATSPGLPAKALLVEDPTPSLIPTASFSMSTG